MGIKKCGAGKLRSGVVYLFAMILAAVFCLGAPGIADAQKKPIPFKFGFVSVPAFSGGQAGVYLERNINEACKGEIEAKFFPNALLGADSESIDKTRMGTIQGMICPVVVLGNTVPFADVLGLPYVFDTYEKAYKFHKTPVAKEYLKMLEGYGFKGLGLSPMGVYGLQAKPELKTLADVSKCKFRVAEVPIYLKTFEAFGVKPLIMPFPDVYEALKQGVVDGCDLPPETTVKAKFGEVTKNYLHTAHSFGWYILLVNKGWYDRLSADLKAKVDKAAEQAVEEAWKFNLTAEKQAIDDMKTKLGVKYLVVSPEEREKFKNASKGVVKWRVGTYNQKEQELAKKVLDAVGYKF